jgi:signal transduction histidine kinase/CheY-like chemotaxis protein
MLHSQSVDAIKQDELKNLTDPQIYEVQMKLGNNKDFEWYSLTLIPVSNDKILCFALNIEDKKRTRDLLTQTQQMLDMAFTYSDVRMWSFENTRRESRAVLTLDSELKNEIVMDWSTLEHNVVPEYKGEVTQAFKDCLSCGGELEIEVPFFFDDLHWLLLRGMMVEEASRRRLIGIYVDLTDIKEASHELQLQKAAAEEASMAKSMFLANMSHEIRTPLNGICGLLEILQAGDLTSEQFEITNCIQSSFTELLELLNDTLDLAKLESHKLMPLFVKFDPLATISTLQESLFTKKKTPDVIWRLLTQPEEPVFYWGDPHCMLRVIFNLVSNATKFCSSGSIDITVKSQNDSELFIVVSDTGSGMTSAVLQGIRDHFDHGENMAVYEESCVGVGLSLVTEMVRFMKGSITVDSIPGKGTTFWIVLPFEPVYYPYFSPSIKSSRKIAAYCLDPVISDMIVSFGRFYGLDVVMLGDVADAEKTKDLYILLVDHDEKRDTAGYIDRATARGFYKMVVICYTCYTLPKIKRRVEVFQKPLKPEQMRSYFEKVAFGKVTLDSEFNRSSSIPSELGLRVLAVDDNSTNQLVIKGMLKKLGCTFEMASNGIEAIELLEKENFDVVLMDQFMPILDGPAAARRIRAMDCEFRNIHIIGMTAGNTKEDEDLCLESGMNGFVTKPTTLNNLARVLHEVCK